MIKISFGMIVLNGEPFIKYNLENLYLHAHEIIIVEGAVEKFAHAATPDGHSIDSTIEVVKNFPDPANKIKLIQHNGFWPEKDEMCNAYMEACTGDYIWQVDVDEFYKSEDIEIIRGILASDSDITQVNVRTVGFWRSFNATVKGATLGLGADEFIRIFKFKPGYRYLTHRPPTLQDEAGKEFTHTKVVSAYELETKWGIVQYHYSYIFSRAVSTKCQYYSLMGWGRGCQDGLKWFKESWSVLNDPLRIHLIDFPPSWIEPYNKQHPAVVDIMIAQIGFEEDRELTQFLKKDWMIFANCGQKILEICKQVNSGSINRILAIIKILMTLLPPTSLRQINSDRAIIRAAFRVLIFGKRL